LNIEKEIELIKHQISLLKAMVPGDEFPFYMFVMDHEINKSQQNLLMHYLYLLNHRLSHVSGEDMGTRDSISTQFYESKKSSLIDEAKALGILNEDLFTDDIPNYLQFRKFVRAVLPESVNPVYLLKSLKKQGIFPNLCEYLLKQANE